MKLYVAGVCGTFMGSLAMLARELGHEVRGCDAGVYPPMSEQLASAGIQVDAGFEPGHLTWRPDLILIGNAMTRGNPLIEHVLRERLPFTSGPAWIHDHLLGSRRVAAVAGTHGKTTTSTMLAWILDQAGLAPGFLIGGVPLDLDRSARVGQGEAFVIEADEYDTAFFDKRSKFVHYRPDVLIINNVEFDHADIFEDLTAVRRTFHHVVRIVPDNGAIIHLAGNEEVDRVLRMGCWTPRHDFGIGRGRWQAEPLNSDASALRVRENGTVVADIDNPRLGGLHNAHNALAALAAATCYGVEPAVAARALSLFQGVRRRMEHRGTVGGVDIYDDFAHHPTAIRSTLEGVRAKFPDRRIVCVVDPASNTMRAGVHQQTLAPALGAADDVLIFQPADIKTDLHRIAAELAVPAAVYASVAGIVSRVSELVRAGDIVLVMSNGGFQGIHEQLLESLGRRFARHVSGEARGGEESA